MIQTFSNRFSKPLFFFFLSLLMVSCEENQIDVFGEAKIKIANVAAHSRTQQFFFIGGIIARDLDYAESSNSYITVKSGDKLVAQFRDQRDGNILASDNIDLHNKDRYTIYLAEDNTGRERIYTFKDDLSLPQKGAAKIKFIHLSGTAPSEVSFYDHEKGTRIADAARSSQTGYFQFTPGNMSISVRRTGQTADLAFINIPQLLEGRIYTVVLTSSYNGGYDMLLFRHN